MKSIVPFFCFAFILIPLFCYSQTQIGDPINGESEGDRLGRRRTISFSSNGKIIALGAPENDTNGYYAGHVRVFENIDNTWMQVGTAINGMQPYAGIGYSTSLSANGSILAIGAGNSTFYPLGLARVYQNTNGIWTQIGDDIYGEQAYGDHFGGTISLSSNGNILAVGDFKNSQNGYNSGHARIYENINNAWVQIGNDIDGTDTEQEFGRSVSLSSNGAFVAIGAPGNDAGIVRVYENNNGSWMQVGADILGENTGDSSGFAISLSSNGNIVAIGAHENGGNGLHSGHVRILENINGTWTQIGNDIDGEARIDFSGFSLDLSANGDLVAIGAYANDGNGSSSGHVRLYKNNVGSWEQIGNDIDGENTGQYLGRGVALSGDGTTVACGVWGSSANGTGSGQVLVYDITPLLSNPEFETKSLVKLFPNPTNNMVHIEATKKITSIQVYTLLGQVIYNKNQNSFAGKIDLSRCIAGVYLVEIKIGDQTTTHRVIKE
ncbi:T9SS type A sorting domain-containing protein [Lacinutrix sp. WUR7]|uniref:T9SS type A sorting domain-containing protein n=1 Tax=Lacinutrix sp. WUR7 TaxID=2653681 RepID=UPI00193E2F8F|nr:T9SS type A sorting domain-containing protein [Lacinutrix sp. WUR7]QRM87891.1 T9SS type A sorting domain-containing protein [Lacinutrix sp. WUR7]